jgi:phosphoenolpyruvate carboxykinase (GTP)
MQPFTGYHMADYWAHWLEMGEKLGDKAPAIFQVNWFRRDADGRFLWPGFGENIRALAWATAAVEGTVDPVETPIGLLPNVADINVEGLDITDEQLAQLFDVPADGWEAELDKTEEYFESIGEKVPAALHEQLRQVRAGFAK